MATVTTLGRGVAMAVPTEMQMTLRLWAQEAAPDAALDRVAERDVQLRSVLDDLGVPAPARTTVRASVEAVTRWDEATQTQVVLGYRADAVTSVHFGDQAVAGRLMREATALSIGAQVQGPWWQIPPDDPARLQACRLAVDDARARAQAYAEAAGARLGTLVTIVDAGASAPGTPKSERMMAGMVLSGASEMDVSSGELQVSASVEVTFDLTAP
jgi:uncharacterized protein YggE